MTAAELIADYKAKKAAAEAAEAARSEADDALYRKIDNSNKCWWDPEFKDDHAKVDDLKHEHNVAVNAFYSALRAMKDGVHELRGDAERLWFKREQALNRSHDSFYGETPERAAAEAAQLEQGIREAFAGVQLLIAAIGWDPARDLVDEE